MQWIKMKFCKKWITHLGVLTIIVSLPADAQSGEGKIVSYHAENSFAVVGGMGINLVRSSQIVDYINSVALYSQRVNDWGTAVDFFGGVEFPVSNGWGIKLEESYLFQSYSFIDNSGASATFDFFYSVNAPSVIIQKVITGKGYFVKLGAGGGYRIGNVTQKISTFGLQNDYVTTGGGIKVEIVGQTAFDDHFYGYIGGQMGEEILGKLAISKQQYLDPAGRSPQSISLRYFYAGLRFGVIYFI